MGKINLNFKSGDLVYITKGDYDAYCCVGVFRFLKDINLYKSIYVSEKNFDVNSVCEIFKYEDILLENIIYLTQNGFLEKLEAREICFSGYGDSLFAKDLYQYDKSSK